MQTLLISPDIYDMTLTAVIKSQNIVISYSIEADKSKEKLAIYTESQEIWQFIDITRFIFTVSYH